MKQYHKIQTVFLRDPETKFKTLLAGQYAKPEFAQLAEMKWLCTEKIDGTNIRVIWDGQEVQFRGKTDRAQIPKLLLEVLESRFTTEKLNDVFGNKEACLYGEGYGHKIQSGKGYLSDSHDFILFDVNCGGWWLGYGDTRNIAKSLDIDHVPVVGMMTISEAVEDVRKGFLSFISEDKNLISEGLILKPMVDMYDRKGDRIITKIKHKDFGGK